MLALVFYLSLCPHFDPPSHPGLSAAAPTLGATISSIPSWTLPPRNYPKIPASSPNSPVELVAEENESADEFNSPGLLLGSLPDLPRPSGLARIHPASFNLVSSSPDFRSPRLQC
jgi:hypothetical protein